MQTNKIAWLAGLWDGEGSITIFKHKDKGGIVKFKPCLVLTNTDPNIIYEAIRILDELNIRFHVIDYTRPRSKRIYQLTTSKLANLKLFCETLTPYLVGKRAQAELLSRYVESRLKKFDSSKGWGHKTPYDDDELGMEQQMRILNHRGESSEAIRLTPRGDDMVRTSTKLED